MLHLCFHVSSAGEGADFLCGTCSFSLSLSFEEAVSVQFLLRCGHMHFYIRLEWEEIVNTFQSQLLLTEHQLICCTSPHHNLS